jgi:2-isopropylmalate synthase
MDKKIVAYDVTLRDGTQGEGVSFSVEDKVRVAHKIDELGVGYIEGGWPGSNERDEAFFNQIKNEKFENAIISAFGSTRRFSSNCDNDNNIQALLKAETKAITIVGKTWDFHVKTALKIENSENLELISDSIKYLSERTDEVFFDAEHFFDGFKNNDQYALECLKAAVEAGSKGIILCDTNGGSTPQEINKIVKSVKNAFKNSIIGIHTHNDSDFGVANAIEAVISGATQVQGTINGYGERCGNANLCSIIANLNLKLGYECIPNEKLKKLSVVSSYINDLANLPKNNKLPYVGRSAFAHKGGIHVSAVIKDSATYEHIEPDLVGNKRRVLISDLSGRSNIVYKLKELGIKNIADDSIVKILEKLKILENEGYEFEGVDASFELLVKETIGAYKPKIELIETEINTRQIVPASTSSARVKIRINDKSFENISEGSGPVNALDNALREILVKEYPDMKDIELMDYRVRVVSGNKGTESLVRVIIETSDKKSSWSTIGVSRDIVQASWKALIDSVEYKLMNQSS